MFTFEKQLDFGTGILTELMYALFISGTSLQIEQNNALFLDFVYSKSKGQQDGFYKRYYLRDTCVMT